MWTVVYITQSRETAETIRNILESADIIVKMRAVTSEDGGETGAYEILVPETEIEQAHCIIIDNE